MLQQVLASCESIDSDLSVFLDTADNAYCAYVGVSLIERVSVESIITAIFLIDITASYLSSFRIKYKGTNLIKFAFWYSLDV